MLRKKTTRKVRREIESNKMRTEILSDRRHDDEERKETERGKRKDAYSEGTDFRER